MKKTGILFFCLAAGAAIIILCLSGLFSVSPQNFFSAASGNAALRYSYVVLLYALILATASWRARAEGMGGLGGLGLGWSGNSPKALPVTAWAVLFFILYLWAMILSGAAKFRGFSHVQGWVLLQSILFSFLFALVEELLFRGFVMRALLGEFPPARAFVLCSIIFALLHIFRPGDLLFKAVYFAGIFSIGMVLCYGAYRASTLWVPIFLHSFWILAMYLMPALVEIKPASYNAWEILWGIDGSPPAGILGICMIALTAGAIRLVLRDRPGGQGESPAAAKAGATALIAVLLTLQGCGGRSLQPPQVEKIHSLVSTAHQHALKGNHREALPLLDEALAIDPGCIPALEVRSSSLYLLGRKDEAMKCLDTLLKKDPGNLEGLLWKGAALREEGRRAEAAAIYRAAIEKHPGVMRARLEAGDSFNRMEMPAEALKVFDEALQKNAAPEEKSKLLIGRAFACRALEKWQEGEKDLQDALVMGIHKEISLFNLADLYVASRQRQKALEAIARYEEMDPAFEKISPWGKREIGHFYRMLGDLADDDVKHEEAVKYYTRAIQVDGEADDAYNNRGVAYLYLGRVKEARQDALKWFSMKVPVKTTEDLTHYANAYFILGDCENALKSINQAIEREPGSYDLYSARAAIYTKMGRHGEAKNDWEKYRRHATPEEQEFLERSSRKIFLHPKGRPGGASPGQERIRPSP
jgi:tetratricopeptide (TPR) repeat protein